ncbi:MAG TPA: amidohydrolase family protein, partial [Steroidobacteraceae bacterium]|nr:amidohydrolase family protein [Steroidobacteraceae bacterium]
FGVTCDCMDLMSRGCVALGSDSRLSGAGDLLDELRVAHERCAVTPAMLEPLVTTSGARLLGLSDRGRLAPGFVADCIVLPQRTPLGLARRADLRCVVLGGSMVWGDADYADRLIRPERRVPATLDGHAKVLDRALAESLRRAPAHESGVRLEFEGRAA